MTPAELDRAEREINANLAVVDALQGAPRRRVCLHPDRTRTATDRFVRDECDYCPVVSVVYGPGTPADLMPHIYLEE
jgi:hypothetical protein